ncbi:hypothetical protein KBB68_03685 [Candidatus Babeliales bacterium]|nr:hypothetical protein [Candidatus Babeliales bacterium]
MLKKLIVFVFFFSNFIISSNKTYFYPPYRETKASRLRKENKKNKPFQANIVNYTTSTNRITQTLNDLNSKPKPTEPSRTSTSTKNYLADDSSCSNPSIATPRSIDKNVQNLESDIVDEKHPIVDETILASSFNLNLNQAYLNAHGRRPTILALN